MSIKSAEVFILLFKCMTKYFSLFFNPMFYRSTEKNYKENHSTYKMTLHAIFRKKRYVQI